MCEAGAGGRVGRGMGGPGSEALSIGCAPAWARPVEAGAREVEVAAAAAPGAARGGGAARGAGPPAGAAGRPPAALLPEPRPLPEPPPRCLPLLGLAAAGPESCGMGGLAGW